MVGKRVQLPRGTSVEENNIIGLAGQLRADMTRGELRLHNGKKPGGTRIPNYDTVAQMIATGAEGSVGVIRIMNTVVELQGLQPSANAVVIVRELGTEDMLIWRAGQGDNGTIQSAIDGHWRRLDGIPGTLIRLWRAGLVNIQFEGAVPGAAIRDKTIWMVGGEVRIYDGANYVQATPILFARYMAAMGGYFTGSFGVPDRLKDILVELENLDTFKESGWRKTMADAANSPVAGVHYLEGRFASATEGMQILWVDNSDGSFYIRFLNAGAWTGWKLSAGQLPRRLEGQLTTYAANLDNIKVSGFDTYQATAIGRPDNEAGSVITMMYAVATHGHQLAISRANGNTMYARYLNNGVWGAWMGVGGIVGSIIMHAGSTAPSGTLKANGATVSRVTYAALFAAIGTIYGAGDGSTTFRLPDLRGEFIRGWDDGRGVDTGRAMGSWQGQDIQSHAHSASSDAQGNHSHSGSTSSYGHNHNGNTDWAGNHNHRLQEGDGSNGDGSSVEDSSPLQSGQWHATTSTDGNHYHGFTTSWNDHSHSFNTSTNGNHSHNITVNAAGGNETRPRNVALLMCIKY